MDNNELTAFQELKRLLAIHESTTKQRSSRHAAHFLSKSTGEDDLAVAQYRWTRDYTAERCSSTKPGVPSSSAGEND
ncbi:MAG: hypothetical protein IJQ02_01630 [Oscillospiraceae bacterium]|nr:hypothetical protein [Oscillospiraceae bacterium]